MRISDWSSDVCSSDLALEQEGLVGQQQRIAVVEVHLHLGGTTLVGQGVDVDALHLAEVVDVLEDRVELVHRVDAIGLAAGLAAARAADRRHQRIVRVGVHVDQEEFQLRRHHRLPALVDVELEDALQDVAGGDLHLPSGEVVGVADHLRRRLGVPGRSEEHTSQLQSLMRNSYAVFCLKKKKKQ